MQVYWRGLLARGRPLLRAAVLLWGLAPVLAMGQVSNASLQALQGTVPAAQRRLASPLRAARQLLMQHDMATAQAQFQALLRMAASGSMEVYLHTSEVTSATLEALRQQGVNILRSDTQLGIVYARMPAEALEPVARLPFVRWIGPPSYSVRRVGSVTSEGDAALRADLARAMRGLTGAGVRVGVISDSLIDLGTSVNSGDLPADVTIVNGQNGASDADATDEGRAMAEIIYDLAPGASLLFRTGFPTSLDFIAAVRELVAAGAHVIVDDLGFFDEPVFEDGPVAQAVRQAIAQGVVYVSAAGNDARRHYQGMYQEFAPDDANPQVNLHDFGGGETRLEVQIGARALVVIFLQWPNPFDGSANTADYDLLLVDSAGNSLAVSNDIQRGTAAPPLEVIVFFNQTDQDMTAGVVINRVSGAALPLALHFNTFGRVTVLTHNVPAGSVFGHPCVRDVLAVGAIDAHDPGFDTLEGFSSRGPCEVFFPNHEWRTKPDLVGADGVMTSLPDFTPFFGTSAAAPHVAAVVALLMEAAGGPGMVSNSRLANTLRVAAVPRVLPGVNNTSGHGVVDTVLALQALRSTSNMAPRSVIEAPGGDMTVAPNTSLLFQGNCVDAEGDSPFAFAWNFGTLAPPSTVQNPGIITFPTVGVFPVTLTCSDAMSMVDTQPAVRTITVNTPPDSQITSPAADATVAVGGSLSFAGSCSDQDNQPPAAFLWHFGGGASPTSSTQQNPGAVTFTTSGTVTISFACTDALGGTDPSPATRRVTVMAVSQAASGGGGGGSCTLTPGYVNGWEGLVAVCGNLGLLLFAWLGLRLWRGLRCR
ncbi:MAG: S8 family serine peptidase [Candidatus Tectimicrobiota bacterium]